MCSLVCSRADLNDASRSQRADEIDGNLVQHVSNGIDCGWSLCAHCGHAHRFLHFASLTYPRSWVGGRLCRYRRRHTCVGARNAWEFTRMSFETFALIWPALSISTVVIVVSVIVHFQDRAERDKLR